MRWTLCQCWMLLAVACAFVPAANGAEPAQIDQAIQRGRDYLYGVQKDGTWEKSAAPSAGSDRTEPDGGQWGGTTALCTYALLASGESYENAQIKSATEFLLKAEMSGIYGIGMRAQVWNLVPKSPQVKLAMQKDMQLLLGAVRSEGAGKGMYDYLVQNRTTTRIDHSVSQIGVLGAWACTENLEGFGPDYWKMVDEAWRATQHPEGSWSYAKTSSERYPATIAMTAAGVATLFITQDFLSRGRSLDPQGNTHDPNIDKGIKWISDNYTTLLNGNRTAQYYPYYGLYGVERVGVASGYRFLGNVNWYSDGVDYLLKEQNRNGGWGGVVNTAFAMIFLSRGRAPIVMNKLNYEVAINNRMVEANWNQRSRDAANLAKFVGRQTERLLNWQIIDFKASVQEMLDAPILYISGNQALSFTTEQKQKLRQFIEQGGLILAHADVGSVAFANSVKKLGTELFKYEFRTLPAGHVVYTGEQFPASKWRRRPNVLGLSNGVRELILLLPDGDPARYWQAYDVGSRAELFELVANIFQYSVDKQNLRNKGETYLVKLDEKIKPAKPVKVARVKYAGNWDPEPFGWTRLAAISNNENRFTLATQAVELAQLGSADVKVAHLTGTTQIKFSQPERDAIKMFLEKGGVLIVDSAGGSPQFSQAIEQEFDAIFGPGAKSLKEPLPPDHRIYQMTDKLDVSYRQFARQVSAGDLDHGRLRAMVINGKPTIIYSPVDLSAGLVGQPVDGINGYAPATASRLMTNILLYASGN